MIWPRLPGLAVAPVHFPDFRFTRHRTPARSYRHLLYYGNERAGYVALPRRTPAFEETLQLAFDPGARNAPREPNLVQVPDPPSWAPLTLPRPHLICLRIPDLRGAIPRNCFSRVMQRETASTPRNSAHSHISETHTWAADTSHIWTSDHSHLQPASSTCSAPACSHNYETPSGCQPDCPGGSSPNASEI